MEVPKSPGGAPADPGSLGVRAAPGVGPALLPGVEGPADPSFPEAPSFPEGHVPAVHLEDVGLSFLEVGGQASCLGEQGPDFHGGPGAPAFLWGSVPSMVPETQDPGSLGSLDHPGSHEDEEVLAFL